MTLFEAIEVWKRGSQNQLVCYRCFRNMETNKYSVQSSDNYPLPIEPKRVGFLQNQFVELLQDEAPDERAGSFDTLSEAIEAHERELT